MRRAMAWSLVVVAFASLAMAQADAVRVPMGLTVSRVAERSVARLWVSWDGVNWVCGAEWPMREPAA